MYSTVTGWKALLFRSDITFGGSGGRRFASIRVSAMLRETSKRSGPVSVGIAAAIFCSMPRSSLESVSSLKPGFFFAYSSPAFL